MPGEWPEIKRLKATNSTTWAYFRSLIMVILDKLGEETTCMILEEMMARNARKFFLPGLEGFGIKGNDPAAIAKLLLP